MNSIGKIKINDNDKYHLLIQLHLFVVLPE